jgi:hypothetical protein
MNGTRVAAQAIMATTLVVREQRVIVSSPTAIGPVRHDNPPSGMEGLGGSGEEGDPSPVVAIQRNEPAGVEGHPLIRRRSARS